MDMQHIVHRYIYTFNEKDAARRRLLLEDLWTEDGRYVDPNHSLQGWDELNEAIGEVHVNFPDHVFKVGGKIDAHHETARFIWHFNAPNQAEPLIIGFDVIAVENDRIRQVYGFVDKALE
jgi:SnoaL-like domain